MIVVPSRDAAPTDQRARFQGKPRSWIERVAAAILSAVVIGRLLTPTDGAPTGETLWLAQASLLALLVWTVDAFQSPNPVCRLNRSDVAVGLFCLGHVIGALLVVATSGDKRAAITMLWEWVGVAVTWFLMRRLLEKSAERQAMLFVVSAAAVSLAGLGVWQHHIGYAQTRQAYEKLKAENADPATSARARAEFARLDIPTDEGSRILWEQRLYSAEPIGMFALANTLAGVLVCTAILWLGWLVYTGRALSVWGKVTGGVFTGLILYCLLLTKSRTAFVGLACGLSLWGLVVFGIRRAGGGRRICVALAGATTVLAVLVGIAGATGGLDKLVISESTKSLQYRFEYWSSTWHMLWETPPNWLAGVGPGNFRQHYLQFKLPQSSEEIADPHNLVLDVWANGGLLGLVGLAGVGWVGLRPLWQRGDSAAQESNGASWRIIGGDGLMAGGLLGYVAVLCLGLGNQETLLLLSMGWLLVVFAGCTMFPNEPAPVVYAAAFAALVVHLLGAGGIGMPAIIEIMLLLIVLGGGDKLAGTGWQWDPQSRLVRGTVFAGGLALFMGCLVSGLMPVSSCRTEVAEGIDELFGKGNLSKAERKFQLAAEADPHSSIPWERLSGLAYQRWLAADKERPDEFGHAVEWQRQAIARDPRNPAGYRLLADLYLTRFRRAKQAADAAAAVDAMRQALALYPNHAVSQSQLAESLALAGRPGEAKQVARRALELDGINDWAGHIDKRLPPARLKLMREIAGATK